MLHKSNSDRNTTYRSPTCFTRITSKLAHREIIVKQPGKQSIFRLDF